MDGVFQQLWTALDRLLPFLDEPWRRIVGVGVPTALILGALFILVRLALRPYPKNTSSPLHNSVSARVGEISSFMRLTLPARLDSPMARQGTQAITIELLHEVTELRKLKIQMTGKQVDKSEAFIQVVVDGVNELIDAIKTQAASSSPDISQVNSTLKKVTDHVDESGRALLKFFD